MLRPEMPQASKRLGQLNPCCDHNIGIIHTITSNIDKGVKISLETLRVNLAQCFKGVSQRDLCLYEEKIENYDLIIKVYQEIFLMLRECHLTEITENIFNVNFFFYKFFNCIFNCYNLFLIITMPFY